MVVAEASDPDTREKGSRNGGSGARASWWGELIVTLGLAGFAVAYVAYAGRYRALPIADPGPGLLPMIYGMGLLGASIVGVLTLLVRRRAPHGQREDRSETDLEEDGSWAGSWRPLLIVGLLLVFSRVAAEAGFLASSWVVFVVVSQILRPGHLIGTLVAATAVVGTSYLVFVAWLSILLPRGFVGF